MAARIAGTQWREPRGLFTRLPFEPATVGATTCVAPNSDEKF
jgi:hypothetical protein